jgi:type-F conjugative transfer system pilin assembly protein TrbC
LEEEKLLYALIFSLLFAREAFAEDFQSMSEEGKVFAQEMLEKQPAEEDKKSAKEMLNKQHSEEGKRFAKEMLNKQPSEEGKVFAEEMVKQIDSEKFREMTKQVEFLTKKLPDTGKGCKNCSSQIENIDVKNPDSGIFVFVSFSMPKASLIELNNQAQKYNATLVMRGIYKNSFHEMRKKILEISPDGLSINVDPKAFEKYNIKQVPTFVLVEKNREINRLSGNVSLDYAHEKLSEAK